LISLSQWGLCAPVRRLGLLLTLATAGCSYLLPSLAGPPNCLPGTVLCNNLTCSDLRTDPYNCGFCENACGQGLSCKYTDGGFIDGGYVDGGFTAGGVVYLYSACRCTIPEAVFWNGACYDLSNDPLNCGAIGQACATTQVCIDGGCGCAGLGAGDGGIVECPGGDAGHICADLRGDPHHCGACQNDCGDGGVCQDGACASLDAGMASDAGPDAGVGDGGEDAGGSDAGPDGGDGGP
jgi:hypothetical protein